jgi:hypothetical protein
MFNKSLIRDVLIYLETQGWTEIIDERWESKVKEDILKGFPNIDEDTLNHVLNLIICH